MKTLPFELFVGLRYTLAKRKNHFSSFISIASMVGLALGVAVLIVVLSVMNGFGTELRNGFLAATSHMQVLGGNNHLSHWQAVADEAKKVPRVLAASPHITGQGMVSLGQYTQGTFVRGIVPADEKLTTQLGDKMKVGRLEDLRAGEFNMVMGADLAASLGASVGDKVVLMTPNGNATPAGLVPRMKQFTLVGLFDMGVQQYDIGLVLLHLDDAAKLYRMGDNVTGVRLKLDDPLNSELVMPQLAKALQDMPKNQGGFYLSDWKDENPNIFAAIKMEKRVMFIIMALVVAVAAFNIVSTLIMAVTVKRPDIAIMRTLGASPASIMQIFVVQGALIGVIGTVLGVFLGVLIASNIDVIVPFIETLFGVQFLDKNVYQIAVVPSQLLWSDVIVITITAFVLSLLATLYPSWKASKINPAEALRYE